MQLHNHNESQRKVLTDLLTHTANELVQFVFGDPSKDEEAIRAHIYRRGRFDILKQLLDDEYPEPDTDTPIDNSEE